MAENKGKIGNGDPAGRLVRTISPAIYPRNQGYLDNGDCPESPGSGCQQLEEVHYLVDRWAMEQWRMGESPDAEFANLGS